MPSDYEKLTDRDIDALVAERIFSQEVRRGKLATGEMWCSVGVTQNGVFSSIGPAFHYSIDDNAARLVRDRIASLGVETVEAYQKALAQVVYSDESMIASKFHGAAFFAFTLQDATPRQQCIAALQSLDTRERTSDAGKL